MRDIATGYSSGARYLSTRQIAGKFGVSLQTAQRAIKQLVGNGVLSARPKKGIYVCSLEPLRPVAGKTIAVLSNRHDRRFDEAFFSGIKEEAAPLQVRAEFVENRFADTSIMEFGNYLLGLHADGVIALAFNNSALGFYHAMREGLDLVSDIILDELPLLPVLQTDNHTHSYEAGRAMKEKGYGNFIVVGYFPKEKNKRYESFLKGVSQSGGGEAKYICTTDPQWVRDLDHLFYFFSDTTCVFSTDYASNYIVAAKFMQHGIKAANDNFMVYDSEDTFFHFSGLPPVRAAAPSLKELGRNLCRTLLHKWQYGSYPQPLWRRI
jgi:DNA-binding LacI/PurR family transcriptional regulator